MKATLISLIALTGVAIADIPRKGTLQTYSVLWNNSPFTSKPPPQEPGVQVNPLDDYALIGVSPIGAGNYRVTMINKKKPEERIMVFSDDKNSDFKIIGVTRKAGDPLGTVVKLSSGSTTGTISYEEKLLTLAQPVQAKPPTPMPGQPPVPGQPVLQPGGEQRMPRPRVVPPPTPTTNGQQPQAVPQPQSGSTSQHGQQRPDRRRN